MKYVLALLLLIAFNGQAEPFYPVLHEATADSLSRRLWRSPPDTNRVKLLVKLSNNLISSQFYKGGANNPARDTAAAYIRQAQALSKALHFETGQIDSDYALAYLLDENRKEAQKIILNALAHSRRLHDSQREAIGLYFLSHTYENSLDLIPQRIRYFELAANLFRARHDQAREARCLKEIADEHIVQGKFAVAREELLRVVALYRASGYRQLHYTFDLLGAANVALGNYKDALRYSLAAIESAKNCRDTIIIYAFYTRAGTVYQALGQLEKSVDYFRLALQNAEQNDYRAIILDLTFFIARDLISLKRPEQALAFSLKECRAFPPQDATSRLIMAEGFAKLYLAVKQYDRANTYRKQLESFLKADVIGYDYRVLQRVYYTIGSCYLAAQQYPQARMYITKALTLGKQQGNIGNTANAYLSLFKADSAQGKLSSALTNYKRYKAINDSIFNDKNSKQIAGLQIQYDTEKREQSIALLTKRNLVQQMTIRQREFQRNAVLGGSALLVLVLGLGYNRYRLKQRSTRLLEQKQQALEAQQAEINRKNEALEQVVSEKDQLLEERQGLLVEKDWMLKEIHHRVKNNLQVVSSLLATQSRHLHDPQAVAAIRESQNRVQVMALLHQKLYQADNIGRVNLADYGREIVTYLVESFDRQHSVHTNLELASIELETTLATPLGLIINEAVTNALKHAFPPPRRGTLTVRLVSLAPQLYQLTITDDGVGLPPGFDLQRSRSLGMVIIKGLSRQMDGQLAVTTADGVHLSLQFSTSKKPMYAEAAI